MTSARIKSLILQVSISILLISFVYDWKNFIAFYRLKTGLRRMATTGMKGSKEMKEYFVISGNYDRWLTEFWVDQLIYPTLYYIVPATFLILYLKRKPKPVIL